MDLKKTFLKQSKLALNIFRLIFKYTTKVSRSRHQHFSLSILLRIVLSIKKESFNFSQNVEKFDQNKTQV